MEDLAIYFIVAAAGLYLLRWLVSNFSAKPDDDVSCGACPSCETEATPHATPASAKPAQH